MTNAPGKAVLQGPILPYLLKQSLVLFVGLASLTALSLVDAWFVGRLGPEALAAIGFTTPIFLIGMNTLLSLGTGITAVLAPVVGRGEGKSLLQQSITSLWLGFLVGLLLMVLGLVGHDLWFAAMGVTPEISRLLRGYMYLIYGGFLLIGLLVGCLSIIRAFGDSRWPGLIMLAIMLTNIVLDPFFILGIGPFPALGLTGAALATLISLGVGLLMSLWRLQQLFPLSSLWKGLWHTGWEGSGAIFFIALPSAGTRILLPFSTAIITGLLADYGSDWVAAYGLCFRVDILLLMFMIALSSVVAPFVGQNAGAQQGDRLRKGIRYALLLALGYGCFMALFLWIQGQWVGSRFTAEAGLQGLVQQYFRLVPWGYAFNGCLVILTGVLNALQRPLKATLVVVFHLVICYLPLALFGDSQGQAEWIFLAYPLSQLPAVGLAAYLVWREVRLIA